MHSYRSFLFVVTLTTQLKDDLNLAELSTWWLDSKLAVYSVTLLLQHFNECSIRVTILLAYLTQAFSLISTCFWQHNSVIADPILLFFGKSFSRWLIHHQSNFQLIPFCGLSDSGKCSSFFSMQKSIVGFLPELEFSFKCLLLLRRLSYNSQRVLFKLAVVMKKRISYTL